ncbi:putative E3 ubiquitin-protein ligase HECTD1 [Paratrimastix pyriformis]|uniref:E3 ubiquitin-protein ligase HECTD1 n=1 Tax=Paratrimastix pyriformis TaxID=342808 RepID=A0ABQ8UJP5_9EUKA|nr:putative E3 ubiquitin-protein ligase HECTD1 [Paratrimastix pyriformis]
MQPEEEKLRDLTPFEPPKFKDPLVVGRWARFASPEEEQTAGHFDKRDRESPRVQEELFVDTRCVTLAQEVTTRLTRPEICARMLSDQAKAPPSGVIPAWNRVYYFRRTVTTEERFSFLTAAALRQWEPPCLVILDQFGNEAGLQDKINGITESLFGSRIFFLICSSANIRWRFHVGGGDSVPEDIPFPPAASWADFYRAQTGRPEVPPPPSPLADADWFTFVPTRGGRGLISPPFSPAEWDCTAFDGHFPPSVAPPTTPEGLAAFWGDVFLYSQGILGVAQIVCQSEFFRRPLSLALYGVMAEDLTTDVPRPRPDARRCILDLMVQRRTIRFPTPEGKLAVDFRFAVRGDEGDWRLACPFYAQLYMKVLDRLDPIPVELIPTIANQLMGFDGLEEVKGRIYKRAVISHASKLLRVPNLGIRSSAAPRQFYPEPFVKGPVPPCPPAFQHLVPMSCCHPDIDLLRIYDVAAPADTAPATTPPTAATATATTPAPQPPRQVVLLADRITVSDVASHTSALRWIRSAECATVCQRIQEAYGCPPQRKVFVFMTKAAGIRLGPLGDDICRAVHAEGWEVWRYPLDLFFGPSSSECPVPIQVPTEDVEAPKRSSGPIVKKLFTAKALRDFLVAKKMPGVTPRTKPDKARMVERALQLYREGSRMGDGRCLAHYEDPVCLSCGDTVCRSCVALIGGVCPTCSDKFVADQLCPSRIAQRNVKQMQCHCPNRGLGCAALIGVLDVEHHLGAECEWREEECDQCHQQVRRAEMARHKDTTCAHKPMACGYADVGCPTRCAQEDLAAHERDGVAAHMGLLRQRLADTSADLTQCKADLAQTRRDLGQTTEELAQCKAALTASRAEVAQCLDQLTQTKTELAESRAAQSDTAAALSQTQHDLAQTKEQTQCELAAVRSQIDQLFTPPAAPEGLAARWDEATKEVALDWQPVPGICAGAAPAAACCALAAAAAPPPPAGPPVRYRVQATLSSSGSPVVVYTGPECRCRYRFPDDEAVVFTYDQDMDERGLFYSIGTQGRTQPWQNPAEAGWVTVARSSEGGTGKASDLMGRQPCLSWTDNQPNSWWQVDLGAGRLFAPTRYTLRHSHRPGDVQYRLQSWRLEGSVDGADGSWRTLDEHTNEPNAIPARADAMATFAVAPERAFPARRFRVLMTGPSPSGYHCLVLSGLEMYGSLSGPQQ